MKKGVVDMEPRKADLRNLHRCQVGDVPCVEDRAALILSQAIHYSESDHCAISWSAQERAQEFYNTNGLAATLDEICRLGFADMLKPVEDSDE